MKEVECLELLDIKGVDMDLGQSVGDAVTTGQKILLPTSWGVLHACLCPRHKGSKGRAAQPGLGTLWRLCGLTSPDDGAAIEVILFIAYVLPACL